METNKIDHASFSRYEVYLAKLVGDAYELACQMRPQARAEVKATEQDATSLVTQADLAVETFITAALRHDYPDHNIIGEEGEGHNTKLDDNPTFVIDPIDGTLGYAWGWPIWGISVALLIKGEPVVAAVAVQGCAYSTYRGLGYVHRDGEKLTRRARPSGKPLVNIGGVDWLQEREALIRQLWNQKFQVVTLISAVAEAVYLIEGRIVAEVNSGLALWDFAATALLVNEAGALATRWDGSPCFPGIWQACAADPKEYLGKRVYRFDMFYAWPELHEQLLNILRPYAGALEQTAPIR